MLKIDFLWPLINVSHEKLSFSTEAKKGLDCSIGFTNRKGQHKMVDFVIDSIEKNSDTWQEKMDIKFSIKEQHEKGGTKIVKEFTVHMNGGDTYEFNELE